MKKLWLISIPIVIVAVITIQFINTLKTSAEGYLYGYPLVLMEETRKATLLKANQLYHSQSFPDHNFRAIVRPNNDTLYSISWLDLSQGPQVLSVPDSGERYYVMPFMDAWTNVFASVGTRATGNQAGDYVLVGPDWQGELPNGVTPITAPTNLVWMIGRIQTNNRHDIQNVVQLQEQFYLTSLTDWQQGKRQLSLRPIPTAKNVVPSERVDSIDAASFFTELQRLMQQQPPVEQDSAMLQQLATLGISLDSEQAINSSWFGDIAMNTGLEITRSKLKEAATLSRASENGWAVARSGIGRYGQDYKTRAFVAMIGLGALPPEEAMYPNTTLDNHDQTLNGQYRYKIHFPAGQLPPVDAFWSITLYNEDGFLVDNPIGRYTIGDRDKLTFNTDGSLDILIQSTAPEDSDNNWLPSAPGDFALTMRIYLPQQAILEGQWKLPEVMRLNDTDK